MLNQKFALLGAIFTLLLSTVCNAKQLHVEQWEIIDIAVPSVTPVSQPFSVAADAMFTHSSGKTQQVPLFYDGDNQWIIRFSAKELGQWRYKTSSTLKALNAHKGVVNVTKNRDSSNHGAMVIGSKNKQTFSYEDGTPYFLIGYELDWLYALDYHNDKATPKSEHLLSLMKQNGFNHVVMNVFAYDVNWHKDPKLAQYPEHEFGAPKDIFPFLGNNDNPDFSALNVEFFQKLDRSIQLLHDKRMVAHLMIYVWNKLVSWPAMNSEADNMYFDYVIKRYGAYPNIVWDISKEALFYGRADEVYIKSRIERLRAQNYFKRLVTVHDYDYCAKYPEQVDFISTQDWGSELYSRMLNVKNKFSNKPIYNIEHGGYEKSPYVVWPGDYDDAEVSVRRNWMSVFAGVYSTYYWQGSSWNVVIYNPYQQPESFIKPKFEYFKAMAKLFTLYDFSTFSPAPGKNGSGYNLVDKQGTHLIYVPKDNYQMSRGDWYLKPKANGKNKRDYKWFNTLTGEITTPQPITKEQLFISPWRGKADAILISHQFD